MTAFSDFVADVYCLGKNEEKGGHEDQEDESGEKESQGKDKHLMKKMIYQYFPQHNLSLTSASSCFPLWAQLEQDAKLLELKAEPTDPTAPQVTQPASGAAPEPKKPGRRRSVKVVVPPPVQQTDEERIAQGKRVLGARSKAKALAKAQAEAEAAARAALAAKRAAERRAQAQRRLEERKRQQLIAEELKKPTEDMCLTDHKVSSLMDIQFVSAL